MRFVGGLMLGLFIGSAAFDVTSQEATPRAQPQQQAPQASPAPEPAVADPSALPAASADTLKDVAEWLNIVRIAQQFAFAQCDQLASARQLVQLRAAYSKKVEDRLPGYTVNWQTFAIVPKAK